MMALIDRDALIAKILDDGILGNGYSDSEREDDVIDMIKSCQAVDAKPVVHGEWLFRDLADDIDWMECSECHWKDFRWMGHPYCPNCGADMRGVKDE